ncbi:MAG: hypothetical protein JXB36_03265 [Gammaproteobacteria bacterium]|nr:hypothetical protein [Gammaproteobacteria bacterium]
MGGCDSRAAPGQEQEIVPMAWVRIWGAACLGLSIQCGTALAQDNDLDITMTLLPAGAEHAADLTRQIVLPVAAAQAGIENSTYGLATANENRAEAADRRAEARARAADARQRGLDTAAEMRERRTELGAEIGAAAREARENFVRGAEDSGLDLPIPDHLPSLPDNRPELPDRPQPPAHGT